MNTHRALRRRVRTRSAWILAVLVACGDSGTPDPTAPTGPVVTELEVVSGDAQRVVAGRRSPEPIRVRARDAGGSPVAGTVVEFSLSGEGRAVLSQRRALTDAAGVAETYLLQPVSGTVLLTGTAGTARLELSLTIERAPGELRFSEASGAAGLPGHPHPDSIVRVQLLDLEGRPLAGREVWFAGHRQLSPVRDTTDAEGWAETVIRRTFLTAGEGRVYAFLVDAPEVTAFTSRPLVAAARRVVLVSIDGLRGDAVDRYEPPTLRSLVGGGAATSRARTVLPSLTVPAHLSLLSGVAPEDHGVLSQELTFTPAMAELDPLFLAVSQGGAGTRAFLTREGPLAAFETALQCRLAFGLDSLDLVEGHWKTIADAAREALQDEGVVLTFVHVPDPERAGHASGYDSRAYRDAVLRADSAVARVLEALHPEDLLVVTSDHGGGGAFGSHQNGSGSPEDVQIPLILHGPRVVVADLGQVSILDVAPTILWSLGLQVPSTWDGRILLEAFR